MTHIPATIGVEQPGLLYATSSASVTEAVERQRGALVVVFGFRGVAGPAKPGCYCFKHDGAACTI